MKKILTPIILISISSCINSKESTAEISNSDSSYLIGDTISAHYLNELKFGQLNSISEDFWDSLNRTVHVSKYGKKYKLDSNYRTFGWHLYSHGSTYKDYNFSLLWGVAYFAYIVDPESGSYKNIHQWKTSELIDSAKAYDCKVFLTIGNFGKENNAQFLNSPNAQETLIDSVLHLLSLRKANGINLDFESVPAESKAKFSEFVIRISGKLKQVNPEYMISVCLYAVDDNRIFDIKVIDSSIDFYTLMGYDYYGGFSADAGPVSPLQKSVNFGENCLESSVNNYTSRGVVPSKLIVGLPHYGAEWIVNDTTIASKAEKFNSHLSYGTIKEKYIDSLHVPILFDSLSLSSYCNIRLNEHQYRQLWFDDVTSLSVKYDWIKNKKLGGVGIWALGFDNGHQELWKLLSEKFSQE